MCVCAFGLGLGSGNNLITETVPQLMKSNLTLPSGIQFTLTTSPFGPSAMVCFRLFTGGFMVSGMRVLFAPFAPWQCFGVLFDTSMGNEWFKH